MSIDTRQPVHTLPGYEWYSREKEYFLASEEEKRTIVIKLSHDFGPMAEIILRDWDEAEEGI